MPEFKLNLKTTDDHQSFDQLNEFTQGYIETMFFTEEEQLFEEAEEGGWEIDTVGFSDLDYNTKVLIDLDATRFLIENHELIKQAMNENPDYTMAQAGGDFWYTRNGHGVGYWDRDLGQTGEKLSDKAREKGEVYLYTPTTPESEDQYFYYSESVKDLDSEEKTKLDTILKTLSPLENVSGRYGSPMGRQSDDLDYSQVILKTVRLDDGYDAGGAYWGDGDTLWRAETPDGSKRQFVRGKTLSEVKQTLSKNNPGVIFLS